MTQEALKLALEALEYPLNQSHENFNVDMAELISHRAITALRQAIEQADEQEPVAWATREDFYRELDRSVNRMRQQMEIKGVVMRCADYDVALPIIDIREGHVLVGQVTTPPQRQWVGLTDEEVGLIVDEYYTLQGAIRAIEAKLKEKNHG